MRSGRRIFLGVILVPPYVLLLAVSWRVAGGWTFVPWAVGGWFLLKGIDRITGTRG
jgi:hypothetical protein